MRRLALFALVVVVAASCRTTTPPEQAATPAVARPGPPCPTEAPAGPVLPFERAIHGMAAFWIARAPDPDRELLPAAAIRAHNARIEGLRSDDGWPVGRTNLLRRRIDQPRLTARFAHVLKKLGEAIGKGVRVKADGSRPHALVATLRKAMLEGAKPVDELRVAHRGTALRCYPTDEGIYEKAWDTAFDLMQCAQVRFGEPVRVVRKAATHWYVWTTYAEGWVDPAALTPALAAEDAQRYLAPARAAVAETDDLPIWSAPQRGAVISRGRLGLHVPLVDDTAAAWRVQVPSPRGLTEAFVRPADGAGHAHRALTRRAFFSRAFEFRDAPYGWGGTGGKRDCSRMLMDLFGSFGVRIPRNSKRQSEAGVSHRDVGALDEPAKRLAIQAAARQGIVLLYLPGHIMLYVGAQGAHLYALHQFSSYAEVCPTGGQTIRRVNRAAVTSLELGRASSRRAFIERITRLVVIGAPPQKASAPTQ